MNEHLIYLATSVPALGRIEVYADGRVRLADGTELNAEQVQHLFNAVADIRGVVRHCAEVRELKRPAGQTAELASISDFHT